MNCIVSHHAVKRFTQRFRLHFHSSYFISSELTKSLMLSLMESGTVYDYSQGSAFYRNKVDSVYGNTVVIQSKKKKIYFVCTRLHDNAIMLRTVVPDFNPRTIKL